MVSPYWENKVATLVNNQKTMINTTTDSTMSTPGSILDAAIGSVSSVASSAASSAADLVRTTVTGDISMSTNSTGPTWVDSTFRTADATLFVFGIISLVFVVAAIRGDHLTAPSIRMATASLLYVSVVLEAIVISNTLAYVVKLIPCIFTECLVNSDADGSAASIASILYIVFWSAGFVILMSIKLAGWRGISIFETNTDELTGMFG